MEGVLIKRIIKLVCLVWNLNLNLNLNLKSARIQPFISGNILLLGNNINNNNNNKNKNNKQRGLQFKFKLNWEELKRDTKASFFYTHKQWSLPQKQ